MPYSSNSFLERHQNKIIFSSVSFFALHWIFFISVYSINVPFNMEMVAINIVYNFVEFETSLVQELFIPFNQHLLVFPHLVMFPNLYFNSFDVVNLNFLQWPVYVGVLFFTYLLIKKTHQNLLWLLIPVSVFIFNPLINSAENSLTGWQMILPQLAVITTIFLFNKKTITATTFIICTILGIIATFSSVFGIVIWIAGLFGLINYNSQEKKLVGKKWLIIWIGIMIIMAFVYYQILTENGLGEIGKSSPISLEGLSFITVFLSAAFRLKYELLMNLVGIISIFFSIFCVVYLMKLKKISTVKPWLNFLLVGISSAIIAELGRGHLALHMGNEPYYIEFSQFFQIGLLVLIGFIILNLKNNIQKNRIKALVIFLLIMIVIQSILLVPSYYAGWIRGDHYLETKTNIMNCYSLSNTPNCLKADNAPLVRETQNEIFNYFLLNNASFFNDENFNAKNEHDIEVFKTVWSEKPQSSVGFIEIETINNSLFFEDESFVIEKPLVTISGWSLDENGKELDSLYLIINDEPFLKYDHFNPRSDVSDDLGINTDINSSWSISFLAGYLDDGCHKITFEGVKNDKKIGFENEIELCKN